MSESDTGKDDFPEAVGLVIAYAEGGYVGVLDFWRTTSIDHEHLITALAAIAVFLAGQTGNATGQSLEQVLQMLWDMEIGGPLEIDGPLWEIQDLGGLLQAHLKSLLSPLQPGTDDFTVIDQPTVLPCHQFIVPLEGR